MIHDYNSFLIKIVKRINVEQRGSNPSPSEYDRSKWCRLRAMVPHSEFSNFPRRSFEKKHYFLWLQCARNILSHWCVYFYILCWRIVRTRVCIFKDLAWIIQETNKQNPRSNVHQGSFQSFCPRVIHCFGILTVIEVNWSLFLMYWYENLKSYKFT